MHFRDALASRTNHASIVASHADSKAQVTALQLIIGSLQRCTVFGTENRAALVHKATGYSAKLLKKPDQCRAVYTCAHLFWHDTNETLCDADSVLACLKRALKIANAAQVRAWAHTFSLASRSVRSN
jgi:vacuolar protein sorting-associated protein 35